MIFLGYLRIDLAEIRFVLLLFSHAFAIPEAHVLAFVTAYNFAKHLKALENGERAIKSSARPG